MSINDFNRLRVSYLGLGLGASDQVGSGDPRGLGYTTQSSENILIFIIARALQLIYNI